MKNTLTLMIAIWIFVIQMGSLSAVEFKTSNGGTIKVVARPGERHEVSVTPPNRLISYKLIMSDDMNTWADADDVKSIASSRYNGETNTTVFVMRRGVTGQFFDIAPDILNGDRIKMTYHKVGERRMSLGTYDLQTMYFALGYMNFSLNVLRGSMTQFEENITGEIMAENSIPYSPPLFGGVPGESSKPQPTNIFFSELADEVGEDIREKLALLAQNPEAE